MDGRLLTTVAIWVALTAYTRADLGRRGIWRLPDTRARLWWTVGCAAYLVHVAAAFATYHGWSHAEAVAHTARQTAAVVGLDWGGGVWVNYAFTALWIGETLWWWWRPHAYRTRTRRLDTAVRLMFLFMIVNGAVVFVPGPTRWWGAVLVTTLVVTWRGPRA